MPPAVPVVESIAQLTDDGEPKEGRQPGKLSVVPSSQDVRGAASINQHRIVAAAGHTSGFQTFDFKTQKWTDLLAGNFANWHASPFNKYLYFTMEGAEPTVQRLRFADLKVETITSLKDLRRLVELGTDLNVAPDGSPVFTRDIGTEEIYALNVRWP